MKEYALCDSCASSNADHRNTIVHVFSTCWLYTATLDLYACTYSILRDFIVPSEPCGVTLQPAFMPGCVAVALMWRCIASSSDLWRCCNFACILQSSITY